MDALRHKLHDAYKTAAEAVLPVRTESAFAERGVREREKPGGNAWWLVGSGVSPPLHAAGRGGGGRRGGAKQMGEGIDAPPVPPSPFQVLMPAEFVTAGDFLVRACPTWSW